VECTAHQHDHWMVPAQQHIEHEERTALERHWVEQAAIWNSIATEQQPSAPLMMT
jgi:hypothetical protein